MGEGRGVSHLGVGLRHKNVGVGPPRVPPSCVSDPCCSGLQEKEKLTLLERRYHSLTGGRPFPKTPSTLKEVMWPG